MVKLFVGNISATSDAKELRKLFEKYGSVSECDIIRNYAFIHMKNEDEARKACDALNNFIYDNRAIHIEFSTSKLRKAPGMDEVCFRCGDKTHKTNNCPMHDMTKDFKAMGNKRPGGIEDSIPPPKRVECYFTPSRELAQSGMAYEFIAPGAVSVQGARSSIDHDPLLPRPNDRNLSALFDEYLVARERYYFFRDRISAASSQNRNAVAPIAAAPQVAAAPATYATYATVPAAAAPTVEYYSQAAVLPPRSSPGAARYQDVYYAARTNNGYEAISVSRAPPQPQRQELYYRRTENGTYEAFTLPTAVAAPPNYVL